MTQLDIVKLRRKYCLGFDLKYKCEDHNNSPQKKIIGEPKGYLTKKQKSRQYNDQKNDNHK